MTKYLFIAIVLMVFACKDKPKAIVKSTKGATTFVKVDSTPVIDVIVHPDFGYAMRKIELGDTVYLGLWEWSLKYKWTKSKNEIFFVSNETTIHYAYDKFIEQEKIYREQQEQMRKDFNSKDSAYKKKAAVQMSDFKPVK